jgi:metallo-beta-lactamase class B
MDYPRDMSSSLRDCEGRARFGIDCWRWLVVALAVALSGCAHPTAAGTMPAAGAPAPATAPTAAHVVPPAAASGPIAAERGETTARATVELAPLPAPLLAPLPAPLNDRFIVHRTTDARAIPSNGLIAVTEHGLLLVDTAWTEEQTEVILRWGQERFGLPWIGAVITHDHADRDGGLPALLRRGIPVAAVDLTVAKLTRRGITGVTTLFKAADREMKDPRGFEAFYPGPGHTSDNIVIAFPNAGILFGGCLIKSTAATDLGFTGDASIATWPAAIRLVADRYHPRTIVPGHGPVGEGDSAYRHTLDLLAHAPK